MITNLVIAVIVLGLLAFTAWVLYSNDRVRRRNQYVLPEDTQAARETLRTRAWGDQDFSPADPAPRAPSAGSSYTANTLGLLAITAAIAGTVLTGSGR